MTSPRPGIFARLLRFSFLLACVTAILRLYGAVRQQPDILNFSGKAWLPAYLMVAGSLMGLFNLSIWLVLKRQSAPRNWLTWAGVMMNIIAYWLERIFLWAPTQRGTNAFWVIGLHVAWLLLTGISHLQMKRRRYERE